MSDEDMPDLPEVPGLENLLAAYREETSRSPSQVQSALNTVTAHVGSAGAGVGAAGLSTATKVGIAVTLAGVVGVVALAVRSPEPTPALDPAPSVAVRDETALPTPPREELQPEPESAPAPAEPIEAPPAETVQPEPTPKPRPRRKATAPAPKRKPKPAPASTLAEELKRLQQARAALRAGNPARARAMVGAHRIDFPDSTLARERDATEIAALCAEQRVPDARTKAAAFAKAYPGSSRDLLADCDD